TPPELSSPERLRLGGEIAKGGRKAFVASLKQRLSTPEPGEKNKPFTFGDVLGNAEKLRNRKRAQPLPPMRTVLVALLFFGGCLWVIASNHRLLVSFL